MICNPQQSSVSSLYIKKVRSNIGRILKELYTASEERIVVRFIDSLARFYFDNSSQMPPHMSPSISRHKMMSIVRDMSSIGTVSHDEIECEKLIVDSLTRVENAKKKNGIGPASDPLKREYMDFVDFLQVLSQYVKKVYNINENQTAVVYKFKRAYQNLIDIIRIIDDKFSNDSGGINDNLQSVQDYLRVGRNVGY